jgi:catechol 2,3-dioxygenase-like lactoylglutathione lyase family enzyme
MQAPGRTGKIIWQTETGAGTMYFQSVIVNVADLDRSIEFYDEVLGFKLLSRKDQLAAIHAPGTERPQVIVLRGLRMSSSRMGGARHIGMRALVLDVGSFDALERIATELERRQCLVSRHDGGTWTAAFGRDPDRIAIVAGCSLIPDQPITLEAWADLDESLYGVGE